jgi:glycosyltransferase 2 family protein
VPDSPATTRPPASPQSVVARFDSSRRRWFGPAEEKPFQRRTSDRIRVVAAVIAIAVLAAHTGHLTATERAVFQFFNTLPSGLESLFATLYRFGGLWVVATVGAAALFAGRWRLARDLVVSGAAAWALARIIGLVVVEHQTLRKSLSVVTRLGTTPAFPSARLALVVAVVAGASPYLTRPSRRFNKALVLALTVAAMYLGVAYPNDLVAGIALGWGVAAAVHLLFGSPGGHPTLDQITASLAELGIDAADVHLAPRQPAAGTLVLATDEHGPLWVKVIGRDETDSQFLAKCWRFFVYKDSGPTFFFTRLQQLQYEAYTLLLARDGGTRTPDVVIAGTAGPGAALLVARPVAGTRLADADPDAITGPILDALWGQVASLHAARVAHGALNGRHVVLGADGPTIVDFGSASATARPSRAAADIAELLAATAPIVGPERAVAAAARGVGPAALSDSLRFLQPAALTHETRAAAAGRRKELADRLAQLRHLGAQAAGTDEPELQQLYRVRPANLLLAVGTLIAAGALLSQIGDPTQLWHAAQHANWVWLVVAFALSMATNFGFAIALLGTIPIRLPIGPTTELQVAMSFSNLAIPAIGGTAVQIRFLQKQGADLPSAVASGGLLSNAAMIITQVGLFGLAVWLSPNQIRFANIDLGSLVPFLLLVVLIVTVAGGVTMGIRRLRRVVLPPIEHAAATMWSAVRSPRRLAFLIGGNVLASVLYGFCLQACLAAYGASLSFWSLLAANIFLGTLASLIPIPGGSTAVASVGLAGALVAFGVPKEIAVAAVLTNQLVVNYLPALPGWYATTRLIHRGYV